MKFTNTDNVKQQSFFKIFHLLYSQMNNQMKTKNMAVYNHVREQVGDIIAPIQIAIYQEIDK
jgi:hypothetical protein